MAERSKPEAAPGKRQVPVQEGLFYQPQTPGEKPYLIGARCRECGYISFPRLEVCPRCVRPGTMEEAHLSGRGKIDMYSTCFAALPGFPAPSIQGYVNLEEGARIWGLITGVEPSDEAVRMGMEVELVIEKLREDPEGNEIMSYKFRPVGAG
ncbi:MAG TPA: Zn-ribbon domain-containing OB-fold protein [Dehalococcoidales bacterium]|nr:Zn-ribbon domain-containing OB-fold protein [Dehalococcoidales bacterium]